MDDSRLGSTVRAVRIKRGWSQAALAANATGVSRTTISRRERGHVSTLTLETLRAVCRALEIRIEVVRQKTASRSRRER